MPRFGLKIKSPRQAVVTEMGVTKDAVVRSVKYLRVGRLYGR